MALKDQPFLPLYVQDLMTDEKLIKCSPAAHGIYLRLICLLHKEKVYGKVKLDDDYKTGNILNDFSEQFSTNMPFKTIDIFNGLTELLKRDVIQLRSEVISQKRMVKDGIVSEKRSKSGKSGGEKTAEQNKKLAKEFAKAKNQANSENENEIENNKKDIGEYVRTKKIESLEKSLMAYYGFTEQNNADKQSEIFGFFKCLSLNNKIEYFEQQYPAYVEYKKINGFKHTYKVFIGSHSDKYLDGAWNAEVWSEKLKEAGNQQNNSTVYTAPKKAINHKDLV